MQNVVFTGRLAADPLISADGGRAVFRLLENRGQDADGRQRTNGVNCVAWGRGFVSKVGAPGLAKGCEVTAVGRFVDRAYTARDGGQRNAKELVIEELVILDWAEGRAQAQAA